MSLSEHEIFALERLNKECFGEDDEYSKPGSIALFVLKGGSVGVIRDSRNPEKFIGYWLRVNTMPAKLERYGVAPAYHGKGLAQQVLKDFWESTLCAWTYVGTTNHQSFAALLASGFRFVTCTVDWIWMVGCGPKVTQLARGNTNVQDDSREYHTRTGDDGTAIGIASGIEGRRGTIA